ncbi:MAG: hypothetical protein COA42_23690 [Alteromonadaceae bacterium]|nr:MAG: hypothetical protein COA42_23690 [Alteromonadaceae bacterium]
MIEFFQLVSDWLNNDVYTFFDSAFIKITSWYVIWMMESQIVFLKFSWDVAKEVIESLNLSDSINDAWGTVDSTTMGYITFFKLPECLNILMNAYVTRLVMAIL